MPYRVTAAYGGISVAVMSESENVLDLDECTKAAKGLVVDLHCEIDALYSEMAANSEATGGLSHREAFERDYLLLESGNILEIKDDDEEELETD